MLLVVIILLTILDLALGYLLISMAIKGVRQMKQEEALGMTSHKRSLKEVMRHHLKKAEFFALAFFKKVISYTRNGIVVASIIIYVALALIGFVMSSSVGGFLLLLNDEKTLEALGVGSETTAELSSNSSGDENTDDARGTKLLIVGDSRTVGLGVAKGVSASSNGQEISGGNEEAYFIGKVGERLSYMQGKEAEIESNITEGTVLVINMGTNDVGGGEDKAEEYAEYINSKIETWKGKGASIVFMSTNPVDDVKAADNNYTIKDADVVTFNKAVKENIDSDVSYLDSYSYLKSDGFKATDGIHYDNDTYKKLYKFMKNKLLEE